MNKIVLLAIVLFVLGIGGMTGLMFWSSRVIQKEEAALAVTEESQGGEVPSDAEVAPEAGDDGQSVASQPGPVAVVPERTMNDAEMRAARSYFSQVFANMRPEDAAEIFRHMDDDAVRMALMNIPPRAAASILSNMPHERAANLSGVYFSLGSASEGKIR